ncbi:MAG: hypothetical protein CVV64_17355 [Candidatus Wallbacteria bacterium HGW-Wallbacteria-1]|jgi:anti-anti-sigma factor|uniref:Anti-sigma factor antagonist n=1 Tax=Candidatus Wallbacteria bacterium HGW-Wallbacteria-1 TaxID=2013854 RepID=A0A2N1PK91_9BACT|nr:MAG: hypothetical protein CVV64_17355 [Candidatus Wallbacteria bacterium HGW-Wallbacteria-1]
MSSDVGEKMDNQKYTIRREKDIVLLELRNEIDSSAGLAELIELTESLLQAGEDKVIINLDKVTFVDSSAVGWLIRLKKQTNATGGDLKLVQAPEFVIRLLGILHLEKLLEIYGDEEAALDGFKVVCPSCSRKIERNDPFCRFCGHRMKAVEE